MNEIPKAWSVTKKVFGWFKENAQPILAFVTILVLFVYCGQLNQMTKSTDAAEKSANVANETLVQQRRQARASLVLSREARFYSDEAKRIHLDLQKNVAPRLVVPFTKLGGNAAQIDIFCTTQIAGSPPSFATKENSGPGSHGVFIEPRDTETWIERREPLTADDLAKIDAHGGQRMYFYGVAICADKIGNEIEATSFCYSSDPQDLSRVVVCPDYPKVSRQRASTEQ